MRVLLDAVVEPAFLPDGPRSYSTVGLTNDA